MKQLLILIFLLGLITLAFAHEEVTEDPAHDQNVDHLTQPTTTDYSTPQTVGQKSVASWEQAAPYVIIIFIGLGLFAFAMGAVLHPHK